MTKISKKAAYPVKIPVRKDYFVGTDSENNGKTVNFEFESTAKLINELNGTPILNYIFRTDSNIDLTVLTEGVFLSAENETTIANISKLYINKNNFHETNMSDLFRFVSVNRESFLMKLRNSSNLSNAVYFRITDATEFESYFILDVAVEMNNASLPELTNFNVYFFDFELSSSDLAITLPEFNKIVTQTGYTSTETTITFNPSWTWLIKNVSYENSASVVKTIAPTSVGKKRIDSFVLNTSGTFQVVTGTETIGSPIQELTPIDTLYVTFCIVGDAGIESVEPIDLSSYATIDYVDAQDILLSNRITELENSDGGIGLPIAITDVTGLTEELADRYTKSEVDAKVSSVYKFKGNVANYAALPATGLTIGDVYNLLDTGANYAWTGTVWDKLGDTIDISGKEDSSNKSQDIETDKTSTTKYASVKQLYDWAVAKFQAVLVSGTNIKTINGTSLLGSGDITVSAGGAGDITALKPTGIVGVVSNNSFASGSMPTDLSTTLVNTTDYNIASGLNIIQGSNTYSKYLQYGVTFSITRWTQEVMIIPSEINSSSLGVALGIHSDNADILTFYATACLDNTANKGKILFYQGQGAQVLATSAIGLAFSVNDVLKLTLERIDNVFTAFLYNTTLSTSIMLSFTYETDITLGANGRLIPDTGTLRLCLLGGASKITNYTIKNQGFINGLVFIGDSITAGYGASNFYNSYIKNISLNRNWDAVCGVGATSATGINALPQLTSQNMPKIAVIYLGVNDCQNGVSTAVYKSNLTTIINALIEINCDVYLITPTPLINFNSSAYASACIDVAISNNVDYLDVYSLMKNSFDYKIQEIYTDDLTHPNDLGHSILASKILGKFNSNESSGYIKNESITALKLTNELKGIVDLGTTGGTVKVDWRLGIQFKIVLNSNGILSFKNLKPGKMITLIVTGAYTLEPPVGVYASDWLYYDSSKTNYIQIYCADSITPILLTSIKTY